MQKLAALQHHQWLRNPPFLENVPLVQVERSRKSMFKSPKKALSVAQPEKEESKINQLTCYSQLLQAFFRQRLATICGVKKSRIRGQRLAVHVAPKKAFLSTPANQHYRSQGSGRPRLR